MILFFILNTLKKPPFRAVTGVVQSVYADFVEMLSKRFEALDDSVSLPHILNAYKNQSDK
ncbi:hypothetical protein DLK00_06935 [Haemophilus influenzae]|uniref:Uncharacterized protein n=1 Tax=Haemophilus influenzae TaxID=727 RepID=A0A2U9E3J2_HAEIF|nr:hypothetical protein DLK00_06935 [Haemophilus influenzae]AXP39459.1 hypothetical protein CH628_03840 [Haemophilus influenzae]AXP45649.1 hypothetical protein CH639_03375 [Haemophilus influenzae]AXP64499.1 hypothetical protein CH635_03370 [Haemophilus influenzae]AXP77480.1 hypothetical protein CH621_03385 [Haemophilus influenzae]